MLSPYAAGSAYVMLHHAFGEVNGKKGSGATPSAAWARSRKAMARAARDHGVVIDTDAGVREIIVERDRAVGVVLENGYDYPRQICRGQRQSKAALYAAGRRPTLCPGLPGPHPRTGRTAPAPSA